MSDEDSVAIQKFQEYIRIPSVQPDVDYEKCIDFLTEYAEELSLPIQIHVCHENKPIAIITWSGKDPTLPSIILNSHMDVVPVYPEMWTHDPFKAEMDEQGNIYGRGTQDMKNVGIQYLEAVRKLKNQKKRLLRTVHMLFVPDEEIGGFLGMKAFVQTDVFKDLNAGFAFDEGIANCTDEYYYFNGERSAWQFIIRCPGYTGHGSTLPKDSAGKKVSYILNKIYEFRDIEMKKLDDNPDLFFGDVTSINVTMLSGGVQVNVLPSELSIVVDSRIAVTLDLKEWEKTLDNWCKEAGEGVKIEYTQKSSLTPVTAANESNPYWVAFKKAMDDRNLKTKRTTMPGATDGRYLRQAGVPVIGFSPIINTPILIHSNDEHLNSKEFLRGIAIYCNILMEVANVPSECK